MRVILRYTPPYNWAARIDFLSARATPGVERVADNVYQRTIAIHGYFGSIAVAPMDGAHALTVDIDIEIRGEIYLDGPDFDAANTARAAMGKTPYVNRRNGAAGALRNASATYAVLSFASYALGEGGNDALGAASHTEAMTALAALGVSTAGALVGQGTRLGGLDDAIAAIDSSASSSCCSSTGSRWQRVRPRSSSSPSIPS